MTCVCVQMHLDNTKVRRWIYNVSAFLANHSGSVIDAIDMWYQHLKELTDMDHCIICFCLIHPTSKELPGLTCKTCHLKFHATCVYKWHRQSGKSLCPHCQSPWT